MSEQTENSDLLYDALDRTIDQYQEGMTTYQIMGTLMSLMLRLWERNAKIGEGE